ncbi:MAG: glycosyltransferase family 2 protein, partial [Planctomycetota bacterium]
MTAPTPDTYDLSVVVPVKNEEANIAPLIGEITAALRGRARFEIVYVDDGSDDGTAEALRRARHETPELRVVTHERCFGQSAGLFTGVRAARAPWVATLDGDGQNDPADLPRLLDARDADPDPAAVALVAGQRLQRHDSAVKRLSSRVANGVRRRLLRDGARDTG